MPVALTKGFNQKCCDCGIAIRKEEIAYEIRGDFIDYIEHRPGQISILLCSGCRERLIQNTNLDMGDAILKRKEIEREGPGPLKPLVFPDVELDDYRAPDGGPFGI
jgi:hypothetical protein